MLTPPVYLHLANSILVQIVFPFVSIKMCLCSLESQQTHNKLSDNVKCTLRWNSESLQTVYSTNYKLSLVLFF